MADGNVGVTTPRRPLVAGNWKMNGLKAAVAEAKSIADALDRSNASSPTGCDVLICPPATLVMVMAEVLKGSRVGVGAQDCHVGASGAHTGDISAEMLADAGAISVIVGHSERRADHGEGDALVRRKQEAAHRAGLGAIVCVGETAGQRRAGLTLDVVRRQLENSLSGSTTGDNTVVAYEPVWAIGSGLTPTLEDVARVHALIRTLLVERFGEPGEAIRVLYGGSVKPDNAHALMRVDNVDGELVGGASLKSADFLAILAAYRT